MRRGVSPSLTDGVQTFSELINELTSGRLAWPNQHTWLIDTGDLTTFGDAESIREGQKLLSTLTRGCSESIALHGNHDAWPGDFPLGVDRSTFQRHRHELRNTHFTGRLPAPPKRAVVQVSNSQSVQVELYALNSVVHRRKWNWWAKGEVYEDRFWDKPHTRPAPTGLRQLDELFQSAIGLRSDHPTFRIVAIHHPLLAGGRWPWDRIFNASDLQENFDQQCPDLRFHLFLSGHTHEMEPPHGLMSSRLQARVNGYFANGPLQLVIGAFMQDQGWTGQITGWPHQAQVIRMYWDDYDRCIRAHRFIAGRNPYAGDTAYELRPVPQQSANTPFGNGESEEIAFDI